MLPHLLPATQWETYWQQLDYDVWTVSVRPGVKITLSQMPSGAFGEIVSFHFIEIFYEKRKKILRLSFRRQWEPRSSAHTFTCTRKSTSENQPCEVIDITREQIWCTGMVQRRTCHHCWWQILLWPLHRTFCVTQAQSSADVQPGAPHIQHPSRIQDTTNHNRTAKSLARQNRTGKILLGPSSFVPNNGRNSIC